MFIIVMPAYNEAPRIGAAIGSVRAVTDAEIAVVDDGSVDGTSDAALSAGATVLKLPFNLGYGAAIQTGLKYALRKGYRFAVLMDADGQHDPAYIAAILEPVSSGRADAAIGSRFLGGCGYTMPAVKKAGAVFLAKVVSFITGVKITDSTSGFQALNERAIGLYASEAYPVDYPDADVIIMLHRCGLNFAEVPVAMRPNPKEKPMHGGFMVFYYAFKMFLSIIVTMLRKEPGCSGGRGKA